MEIKTISFGHDQNGQKFEFAHDGQKALILAYEGNKWNFISRGEIRSLLKFSSGFGINWDEPDKIRDFIQYRIATKSDRLRKASNRDKLLAPYRTPAMMMLGDD